MNICDYTDLGNFDSCDPIDLSAYAPVQVMNFVTKFDCTFSGDDAEAINLAPGNYYFEDGPTTYRITVI